MRAFWATVNGCQYKRTPCHLMMLLTLLIQAVCRSHIHDCMNLINDLQGVHVAHHKSLQIVAKCQYCMHVSRASIVNTIVSSVIDIL